MLSTFRGDRLAASDSAKVEELSMSALEKTSNRRENLKTAITEMRKGPDAFRWKASSMSLLHEVYTISSKTCMDGTTQETHCH